MAGTVQKLLAYGYAIRVVLERALSTAAAVAAAMAAEEGAEHTALCDTHGVGHALTLKVERRDARHVRR